PASATPWSGTTDRLRHLLDLLRHPDLPCGKRVASLYPHVYHLRPRLLLPPARWLSAGPLRRSQRPEAGDAADYHADGRQLLDHRDPPDVRRRRLARPDPPPVRSHRPRHVARWGGVQRVGVSILAVRL